MLEVKDYLVDLRVALGLNAVRLSLLFFQLQHNFVRLLTTFAQLKQKKSRVKDKSLRQEIFEINKIQDAVHILVVKH